MALADLVQGVIIDMNGQLHLPPKYVGTFRKVDAGLVNAAGKVFVFFSIKLFCNTMKEDDMPRNVLIAF